MPRSLEDFSATKTVPMLLWDDIMTEITAKYVKMDADGIEELKTLDLAPGVTTATYCRDSGKLMTDACKADPRGSRAEIGYFAAGTEPTEYCDTHIMVNYDKVHGGVASPGCDSKDIIQVGLLNVLRKFPFNITVTDAQYTAQILPPNYSYEGLTDTMPYYQNLLPEGFYSGQTSKTKFYNHICTYHPFEKETETPETTVPETIPPVENPEPLPDEGGEQPNADPPD